MQRIGRYEVLVELGRGSMGVVWKARDPQIDRVVAIKVILTANLSAEELEQFKQRFQREAQAAGRMSHPGIVTVYDISEDEAGHLYLVMEYVEGTPLDHLLSPAAERLPLLQVLDIAIQVAHALDYAHRQGVVHRDVKPANILVSRDGVAKIVDFGIAKLSGTQLTQTGHLLGTPAFMSPEQFSGTAVDPRADLFSLGAVLYWMCTGERPFTGDSLTAVSFKIVYSAPIPARQLNASLPVELEKVLDQCLAKSPDDRYSSAGALAADLEAVRAGRPVAARSPRVMELHKTIAAPGVHTTSSGTESIPQHASVGETPSARPSGGAPEEPSRKSRARTWLQVGALTFVLVVFGVGYWFWTQGEAAPAVASLASQPKPTSGRARRPSIIPSEPQAVPVAVSRLRLVCEHNFRSASLEVDADGERLLGIALRGEEQEFGVVRIYQGRAETSAPIAAGRHVLRVRVSSPADGYEDEAETSTTFSEGNSRTLLIGFGKGSAVGVVNRRLTLSWR